MVSSALLLVLLAGPAQPTNDGVVYFDGLKHDGASTQFVPNGPRTTLDQDVLLKVRSYRFDLSAVTLEYWTGSAWQTVAMAFDQDLATCGENPELPFACILWQGTIPGSARAVAYRFAATDLGDTNYVGQAAAGSGHQVFEDGVVPTLAQSWTLPVPAGSSSQGASSVGNSSSLPSSSVASSSVMVSSSAVMSSSSVTVSSSAPGSSSAANSSSAVLASSSVGASSLLGSSGSSAAGSSGVASSGVASSGVASSGVASSGRSSSTGLASSSASGVASGSSAAGSSSAMASSGPTGGDGGPCTPGCRSTTERVVCTASGAPLLLACTAGTECRDGACITPPSEEPPQQGCSCNGSAQAAPLLVWGLVLVLVRGRRRRG